MQLKETPNSAFCRCLRKIKGSRQQVAGRASQVITLPDVGLVIGRELLRDMLSHPYCTDPRYSNLDAVDLLAQTGDPFNTHRDTHDNVFFDVSCAFEEARRGNKREVAKKEFSDAFLELFVWCVLSERIEMGLVLGEHCKVRHQIGYERLTCLQIIFDSLN